MILKHIVDTGPLVALFRREATPASTWAIALLRSLPRPLYTCEPVLTETAFFVGPKAVCHALAEGLLVVRFSLEMAQTRVLDLVQKYADREMELADACLVVMSELYPQCQVITLDAADFRVYRRHGDKPIPLLLPPGA